MTELVFKTLTERGDYAVQYIATAIRHRSYEPVVVNPNLILYPIEEGDHAAKEKMLFDLLRASKPDAVWFMGDPHFHYDLFQIENKIRKQCPLIYYFVWDSEPTPHYLKDIYDCCDFIGCISNLTHEFVKKVKSEPDKSEYIWHCVDEEIFKPLPKEQIYATKKALFGHEDSFVILWDSRLGRRKQPWLMLKMFKEFLKFADISKTFLMFHTRATDNYTSLNEYAKHLGIWDNVKLNLELLTPEQMNVIYNVADCVVNTSFHEGFGLSTITALMASKPIIAPKIGGLQDQFKKDKDGNAFGLIPIIMRNPTASPTAYYIYEDYLDEEQFIKTLTNIYSKNKIWVMNQYDFEWARKRFAKENMINKWDDAIKKTIAEFKPIEYRTETI